jgi:hypothetical protein
VIKAEVAIEESADTSAGRFNWCAGPSPTDDLEVRSPFADLPDWHYHTTHNPRLQRGLDPAGAPRGAPSAPAGARRRFPPASKSGLLAAFFFLSGNAASLRRAAATSKTIR